jgi:hypothetical protein
MFMSYESVIFNTAPYLQHKSHYTNSRSLSYAAQYVSLVNLLLSSEMIFNTVPTVTKIRSDKFLLTLCSSYVQ